MAYITTQISKPPIQKSDELNHESSTKLAIRYGIKDTDAEWDNCFATDLEPRLLDDIYPFLWLVARKSGTHIDSLHKQLIKDRVIMVAEDPKLHLVWYYGVIYIKPLPDYLLNYATWRDHLPEPRPQASEARPRYDKYRAALGFLRSYGFLIRYESDFIIAQRANLLPKYVSFQQFQKFVEPFRSYRDDEVAHRYQYGQLRLTRLNWAIRIMKIWRILQPHLAQEKLPWNYQEQIWQTSGYVQTYVTPLVFIFAVLTLILSSMQVAIAALGATEEDVFIRVSWGFSIAIIVFAVSLAAIVIIAVALVLGIQCQFAIRAHWKR
ncbi:hypothetical protein F5Y04DRAFT_292422 [Hypomontagnella monticulosa]|nr:hypothetical protein F5Y04DRAFT_292422 [Hypomontagnella monticulosa]